MTVRWKRGADIAALKRHDLRAAERFAGKNTRNLDSNSQPDHDQIPDTAKKDYYNNIAKIKTKNLSAIANLHPSRLSPHKNEAIQHFISKKNIR